MDIANLTSLSLVGYIMYPFLRYSESYDIAYLCLGTGMIVTDYMTKALKAMTQHMGQLFLRPFKATECDIYTKNGECGGQPGFPSGHVAVMVMFTTFTHLYNRSIGFTLLNSIMTILISWSRYSKKCHNALQIIGGAFLGFVNGFIVYVLTVRLQTV